MTQLLLLVVGLLCIQTAVSIWRAVTERSMNRKSLEVAARNAEEYSAYIKSLLVKSNMSFNIWYAKQVEANGIYPEYNKGLVVWEAAQAALRSEASNA